MSKSEPISLGAKPMGSGRLVHDLRAPVIIAIGFLEELDLFKVQLLDQLSADADDGSNSFNSEQMSKEIDEEMTLCISMIKDSLDELDNMILDLKKKT